MRKDRTKRKAFAEVEFDFYIVLNGRLSAEQAQAVRDKSARLQSKGGGRPG
jgi:hypothetical protein